MTPTPSNESEIDFAPLGHLASDSGARTIDIVKFAASIWKPLAIGLGAGTLLGVLAYLYLGPAYSADTRILVSEKTGMPSGDKVIDGQGEREQHVDLIRSDAIILRALRDHGLGKHPDFDGNFDPIDDIRGSLSVKRTAGRDTSKDNIFDISFVHTNKETATLVVDAIIASYSDFLDERRNRAMGDLTTTLNSKLSTLDGEIAQLEKNHHEWLNTIPPILRKSAVVTAQGQMMVQPNAAQQELDFISKKMMYNRLKQTEMNSRLKTLDEMVAMNESKEAIEFWIMNSLATSSSGGEGDGGGGNGGGGGAAGSIFAGPPGKEQLDDRLLEAQMLKSRMLNLVGPDHDDVRKLDRQIVTLLDSYRNLGISPPAVDIQPGLRNGSKPTSTSTKVDLATIYRKTLLSQIDDLVNQHDALAQEHTRAGEAAKSADLLELKDQEFKDRIIETKKERQGIVGELSSFRKLKEQAGYTVEQIAQIRVAKSMKRVLKIIGACAVLGLAAVFALSYFREWFDTTLKSVDEVRRNIGAAVLGTVPHFNETAHDNQLASASGLSPGLVYVHRPGSREAEAFRTVRTTLYVATRNTNDKIIQISSAEPSDGKSTSTSNLAIAMAQSGKRVLLVDADLRRPTVHTLFGLRQDVGLSEVLRREIDWKTATIQTRIDGLNILTAGHCPQNPAELLSLATMPQFLRDAREEYDYILMDSPPLLAVSDPCIISPHVDGMVLVVRVQKNKRAELKRAQETLDTHGIRLLGVIVNDAESSQGSNGSYNEYYTSTAEAPPVVYNPPPVRQPVTMQ